MSTTTNNENTTPPEAEPPASYAEFYAQYDPQEYGMDPEAMLTAFGDNTIAGKTIYEQVQACTGQEPYCILLYVRGLDRVRMFHRGRN